MALGGLILLVPLLTSFPSPVSNPGHVMLTSNISKNAQSACEYFDQALVQGDYYTEQKVNTVWQGRVAAMLGLEGKVIKRETFKALASNIDPRTGQNLKVRNVQNARALYDFTISLPKSVSLLQAMNHDPEVTKLIEESNKLMLKAIEQCAQSQSNSHNIRGYEDSGSMIWGSFLHETTRSVKVQRHGKTEHLPQPQWHIHNTIMNLTFSKKNNRFQAIELGNAAYPDLPYFEALFHSYLADGLQKLGYSVTRTPERFELSGVSRSVIERFSERSRVINEHAKKHNITDKKALAELGKKTRQPKNMTVKEEELVGIWKEQLSKNELATIQSLKGKYFAKQPSISAKEAIDRSLDHFLERQSVVSERRLLGRALSLGYGSGLLPKDVAKELASRNNVLKSKRDSVSFITTKEAVLKEERMLELSVSGKGQYAPINPHYTPPAYLNEQQHKAVKSLLNSKDSTVIIHGSAGVGKSTMLASAHKGAKLVNTQIVAVGPSTQATQVLKQKGFEASTVAALLHSPALQQNLQGNILLLDEAGLVGNSTMLKLQELSKERNCRLWMSGDTRQHSSPEAGDSLRILRTRGKVETVTLNKIMRQENKGHREAIQKLANGQTAQGYKALDRLGAVKEIDDHDTRLQAIGEEYVESLQRKESVLVVSPTNYEGQLINQEIQGQLRASGYLEGTEKRFQTLRNASLTNAEKIDPIQLNEGRVVRFITNQKGGIKGGSHWEILPHKKQAPIQIRDLKSGEIQDLPQDKVENFHIYDKAQVNISKGDTIRLTNNGKSIDGRTKLFNGNSYQVSGFVKNGIRLSNGKTISNDFQHFKLGYCETSHSVQGKDSDRVILSISQDSFSATNEASLYVGASRGKKSISIYTSDKTALRKAILKGNERMTAHQIAKGHEQQLLQQKQRAHYQSLNRMKDYGRDKRREKHAAWGISAEPARS